MNGDLKKAAQSMGLEWKATPAFGVDGAVEGLGPAENVREAFTHAVGSHFRSGDSERPDVHLQGHGEADCGYQSACRPGGKNWSISFKSAKARERMELFQQNLRDRMVKEGKIKIYEDVIKRLAASFSNSPA